MNAPCRPRPRPAPNLSNPAPNSSFAAAFSSQSPRSHSTRYRASSFDSRMSRRTVQRSERILQSHSLHSIMTNVSVCSVFLARYRSEGFSSSWRPTCVWRGVWCEVGCRRGGIVVRVERLPGVKSRESGGERGAGAALLCCREHSPRGRVFESRAPCRRGRRAAGSASAAPRPGPSPGRSLPGSGGRATARVGAPFCSP